MKFIRNRTVLGIICIVLAVVICFIITPMFNAAVNKTGSFVHIIKDVAKGVVITGDDVDVVEAGSYNQPTNLLTTEEAVIGKYATADLFTGDYVSDLKVSDNPVNEDQYLYELGNGYRAISLTLQTFACGLSGKLRPGDIVSVIVPNYQDSGYAAILPELQYVRVLAATDSNGYDSDEVVLDAEGNEEDTELPSTVTLLVTDVQAKALAKAEADGASHIELVFRGDEKTAQKYLEEQKKIIKESEGMENEDEPLQEAAAGGSGASV